LPTLRSKGTKIAELFQPTWNGHSLSTLLKWSLVTARRLIVRSFQQKTFRLLESNISQFHSTLPESPGSGSRRGTQQVMELLFSRYGCGEDDSISKPDINLGRTRRVSCRLFTPTTTIARCTRCKSHKSKRGPSEMKSHHAVIASCICLFGLSIAIAVAQQ